MIPTKADYKKNEANIKKLEKRLVDGKLPEKAQMQMLREAVRKVWMRHPVKLLKLNMARVPDTNPDTRTKWIYECEHCKSLYKAADVEIDHKVGNHSCKTVDELVGYAEAILKVHGDDLQVLCKDCHAVKTYMERYDVDAASAVKAKYVAAFGKLPAERRKSILMRVFDIATIDVSNEAKRKEWAGKLGKATIKQYTGSINKCKAVQEASNEH